MHEEKFGYNEMIPEAVQQITTQLCQDVAMLQLKWNVYRELFSDQNDAATAFTMARFFFQVVAESLRHDMTMTICRLRLFDGSNGLIMILVGSDS